VALAGLASPSNGEAQTGATAPAQRGAASGRIFEVGIGGIAGLPVTFGSADATLRRPDGSPFRLFSTENREGFAAGVSAHIGLPLTERVSLELRGAWTRSSFETRLSDDAEGAPPLSAGVPVARVTLEGGALWTIAVSGASSWFVRGSAGWLRELTGGQVVLDRGTVAHVGAGVKYWWRYRPRAGISRLGVRIEGTAALRHDSLSLGSRRVHVAPGISAGFILGS
jgi:hypothetical protein